MGDLLLLTISLFGQAMDRIGAPAVMAATVICFALLFLAAIELAHAAHLGSNAGPTGRLMRACVAFVLGALFSLAAPIILVSLVQAAVR